MRWALTIKSRKSEYRYGWTVVAAETLGDAIQDYEKSFPDRTVIEGKIYENDMVGDPAPK